MKHTCSRTTRPAPALAAALALLGCGSIRNAQPKTAEIDGQSYVFGGSYDPLVAECYLGSGVGQPP